MLVEVEACLYVYVCGWVAADMKGACPLHAAICKDDRGTRLGAARKRAWCQAAAPGCMWLLWVCLDLQILGAFA